MTTDDPAQRPSSRTPITRRNVLLGAAGGALVALPALRTLGAPLPRLQDDYDDSEDDHSGHGNGNGDDRDDDHSGHGGGDDDFDDSDARSDDNDDEGDVAPSGTVPPGSVEVRIVDDDADGFRPSPVRIDAGQTITFVNLDDDAHTATGAWFDTGIMQPGQLVSVTFDAPGSFPFACQIHPVMTGIIEVRDADGNVPASPEVATPEASPAASASQEVIIRNFAFEPAEIEVAAGTTVTWTNEDQAPHTATASDGSFDTGTLDPGQSGSHTFETAGRVDYACSFHPTMTGVVVVV